MDGEILREDCVRDELEDASAVETHGFVFRTSTKLKGILPA
jgi:hypothetical protein